MVVFYEKAPFMVVFYEKAPFMLVFYETYTGALTFENSHKGQEDDTPVKATTFKSPLYSYSDLLQ
jgi:hypothetical protein